MPKDERNPLERIAAPGTPGGCGTGAGAHCAACAALCSPAAFGRGFSTLWGFGFLVNFGTLSKHGFLEVDGTLVFFGFLTTPGSLGIYGFLLIIGSLE